MLNFYRTANPRNIVILKDFLNGIAREDLAQREGLSLERVSLIIVETANGIAGQWPRTIRTTTNAQSHKEQLVKLLAQYQPFELPIDPTLPPETNFWNALSWQPRWTLSKIWDIDPGCADAGHSFSPSQEQVKKLFTPSVFLLGRLKVDSAKKIIDALATTGLVPKNEFQSIVFRGTLFGLSVKALRKGTGIGSSDLLQMIKDIHDELSTHELIAENPDGEFSLELIQSNPRPWLDLLQKKYPCVDTRFAIEGLLWMAMNSLTATKLDQALGEDTSQKTTSTVQILVEGGPENLKLWGIPGFGAQTVLGIAKKVIHFLGEDVPEWSAWVRENKAAIEHPGFVPPLDKTKAPKRVMPPEEDDFPGYRR